MSDERKITRIRWYTNPFKVSIHCNELSQTKFGPEELEPKER